MTRTPLKVLCLDIEGGYGGSSRSLVAALSHVDRDRIAPTVWCKRSGPVQAKYAALGIPTEVMPGLPKASALPRLSRNVMQLLSHAREWFTARGSVLSRLEAAARAHDVVHFNHEGFASLAWWLARRSGTPLTMHVRTNVAPSRLARLQMRAISAAVQQVVFITPNEERTFRRLGGTAPGRVILNPVEPVKAASPHSSLPKGRFVAACLSNTAFVRGTDRLIDIARALQSLGRSDIAIVLAGDQRLAGRWPGELADLAARGGTLGDAARQAGVSELLSCLGHIDDPERVLAGAGAMLKPTREDNPWGRDILEAMAAGVPVFSVGSDATFVESGVTGLLQETFDADAMAQAIARLADDAALRERIGAAARERVMRLCSASDRAADLAAVWLEAAGRTTAGPSA